MIEMKKLLFIATVAIAVIFNACNPMEDINNEIDRNIQDNDKDRLFLLDKSIAPEAYTLTDEDYELSSNEDVKNFKNFSKNVPPAEFLPEILNQKFSGDDAQSMMVTYNYYERPFQDRDNALEIKEEEYAEMGQRYPNFDNEDEAENLIAKLLDRKVYAEEAGVENTVKYTLFSTYETRYIKVNADGTSEEVGYTSDAVEVTDEIYEATGNGKYKNFYRVENALEDLAKYATDNGTAPVTYAALVYQNYLDTYAVFLFDGMSWSVKQSVMPRSEELSYKLDKSDITQSTWKADPAIKVTLNSNDYALFDETSRYLNFDLRSGQTPGTDRNKLVEMIGTMLDTNYDAVEDQQYLVTFAYYDGSSGTQMIRVIKMGGTWSEVVE
jgi:hypothetical protein